MASGKSHSQGHGKTVVEKPRSEIEPLKVCIYNHFARVFAKKKKNLNHSKRGNLGKQKTSVYR